MTRSAQELADLLDRLVQAVEGFGKGANRTLASERELTPDEYLDTIAIEAAAAIRMQEGRNRKAASRRKQAAKRVGKGLK